MLYKIFEPTSLAEPPPPPNPRLTVSIWVVGVGEGCQLTRWSQHNPNEGHHESLIWRDKQTIKQRERTGDIVPDT
jgi:hypothetical protein